MLKLVRNILNAAAGRRLRRNPEIQIASTAKVNFRAIGGQRFGEINIGDNSIVEARITADREGASVRVGNNTFIGGSHIISAESIHIGSDVLISWGCHIVDHDSHSVYWSQRKNDVREWFNGRKDWRDVVVKPVTIEDKVWIGFNVTVLKGVTVGEGAVIGACSVVTRDVPPFTVAVGNPARVIRERNSNE